MTFATCFFVLLAVTLHVPFKQVLALEMSTASFTGALSFSVVEQVSLEVLRSREAPAAARVATGELFDRRVSREALFAGVGSLRVRGRGGGRRSAHDEVGEGDVGRRAIQLLGETGHRGEAM